MTLASNRKRGYGLMSALAGTSPMADRRVEPSTDGEITRMVRNANSILEAKKAAVIMSGVLNDNGNAAPAQPAGELISMATAVANLHQGAANTALQVAEVERKRRIETEGELGAAVEQARQEERDKADGVVGIIKEITALTLQYQKDSADMQQRLAASNNDTQLAAIRAEITAMRENTALQQKIIEQNYQHQLEREREERQRAQQQVQVLSQPKSLEQMKAELVAAQMAAGNLDGVLAMLGVPRGESVQDYLDKGYAQRYLRGLDADDMRKQEQHENMQGLIQTAQQHLPKLVQSIASAVGPTSVGAPYRNGMGGPPDIGGAPPAPAPVPQGPPEPRYDGGASAEPEYDFGNDFGSEGGL